MNFTKFLLMFVLVFASDFAVAMKPMTDQEIKTYIIDRYLKKYHSIGECGCPYQTDENGEKCGEASAYFVNKFNKPKCYPEDIKSYDIDEFRSKYDIDNENRDQKRNYE